jgi:MFS family permease
VPSTIRVFTGAVRNPDLRRVLLGFGCFIVTEYAVWIAMLVYAFDHGGVTTAGLVALAQLVPAAVAAPLVAPLADRRSPVLLLGVGYAVQAVALAATAAAILTGSSPLLAYLCAVVASTAVTTTRPAQAALVPALTREVTELTAANVLLSWIESVSVLVAGGAVGLVLTLGSAGWVFAAGAVLLTVALVLVVPLASRVPRGNAAGSDETAAAGLRGYREALRSPPARLLVGLLGAEYVVVGALDVLFVVMAVDVLDAGRPWVGYLNMAYGAGGVLVGGAAVLIIGRRLGPVIVVTALALAVALALTSVAPGPVVAALLLAVVGGAHALFELSLRALLQRAVAAHTVARIFGLAEGLSMAGLAVGSVLAPLLVAWGGARAALVGLAALLPLLVLARFGVLRRIDQQARVPVVEISLLRSLALFRDLPGPALEGLGRALGRTEVPAGTTMIREGDLGECYYAIVSGTVEISRGGEVVRSIGRGDGMGEIALLHEGRRTATAVASTEVTAYSLDRDSFLTAVNGHVPTLASATRRVVETREQDARRDATDP